MPEISFNRIISIWWIRILFFIILSYLLYIILNYVNFTYPEISGVAALLTASIIVERSKPNGKWYTFGIMPGRWMVKEILSGFLLVVLSMGIIVLSGIFLGAVFKRISPPDVPFFILISFLIFLYVAIEELIFRGIIFQALLDKFNKYVVAFLFSLAFGLVHYYNYGVTVLALSNVFLAGLLFSLMYIKTLSLWLPISFHFFWNWSQAVALGSPVSGYDFMISLYKLNISKFPEWLFGSAFGIEGGVICTIVLILSIFLVLRFSTVSPYLTSKIFERDYGHYSAKKVSI